VAEAFVPAELETRGAILQMKAAKHSYSNGRLELGIVLLKWLSKARDARVREHNGHSIEAASVYPYDYPHAHSRRDAHCRPLTAVKCPYHNVNSNRVRP
jgi:hypothetical protein